MNKTSRIATVGLSIVTAITIGVTGASTASANDLPGHHHPGSSNDHGSNNRSRERREQRRDHEHNTICEQNPTRWNCP